MAFASVAWASCLLLVAVKYLGQAQAQAEISKGCMNCICEAVSGGPNCVFSGRCYDDVCGPYAITLPYWQDSGRPTVGLDDRQSNIAYEKCALDKTCAEAAIRGYMSRFQQDCNGDGIVNCNDYAAIHFHGGFFCNKLLSLPAKNALNRCLQRSGDTLQPVIPPDTNNNNIVNPPEQTTLPQIDIRLGD